MTCKYFNPNSTPAEISSHYRTLAKVHHPDRGGSTATMQAINLEYEQIMAAKKEGHQPWSDLEPIVNFNMRVRYAERPMDTREQFDPNELHRYKPKNMTETEERLWNSFVAFNGSLIGRLGWEMLIELFRKSCKR